MIEDYEGVEIEEGKHTRNVSVDSKNKIKKEFEDIRRNKM
jgi:hypothetical protein